MFDILSPKTKLSKPSRRNNSESNFNPECFGFKSQNPKCLFSSASRINFANHTDLLTSHSKK